MRADGRPCDGFGVRGQIALDQGLRRAPKWKGEWSLTSPPVVYRDLVIVGSSIADNSRLDMTSGEVRAFDAKTGALRWTFHPLPADSPAGAANTWSRLTVDEANGLVYLPVGSASPDYFGGNRPGDNAHANSVVALKAATGEVAWAFQTVHHDVWDYDVASQPLLFPGRRGPSVAVGSKTGHLFLFDRITGTPHFPIVERTVPASDVPEERTAATQPFPSKPASLVAQTVTEADIWGVTPAEREACLARFRTLRYDGVFTPPSLKGSLHRAGQHRRAALGRHGLGRDQPPGDCPGQPARRHHPADPARRVHGGAAGRRPGRRSPSRTGRRTRCRASSSSARKGGRACRRRGASSSRCASTPARSRGAASSAICASRSACPPRRCRRRPDRRTSADRPSRPAACVFIGATIDPYLRAFATADGRELWKTRLPTSARATPLVYTTPSGREMVAIAAGGHDTPLSKPGTTLHVFALPTP